MFMTSTPPVVQGVVPEQAIAWNPLTKRPLVLTPRVMRWGPDHHLTLECEATLRYHGPQAPLLERWTFTFSGVATHVSRLVPLLGNAPLTRPRQDWDVPLRPHEPSPVTWKIVGSALLRQCGASGVPAHHLHHFVIDLGNEVLEIIAGACEAEAQELRIPVESSDAAQQVVPALPVATFIDAR